jgi:hypothetical protein
MAQIRFGSAGTYQNTFNVNPSSIANLGRGGIRITPIRVLDIILDNSHPKFKEYGEWNSIGTIFYEEAYYGSSAISNNTTSNTIAIPLLPNIKQYPLINELTYVIFLPGANLTENPNSSVAYYFPPSNVWNSQHHNAVPVSPNLTPAEDRDYVSTTLGSYRRVTDNSTDIFLGKTFDEKTNLHPLLPYEGDTIYEGRWGNSIRLGSTVGNSVIPNDWSNGASYENGDPITIIRNGQADYTSDPWIPVTEDINNDKSSIYLTSKQQLPLFPASVNNSSFSKSIPPTNVSQYEGNQIILNSGRLVFNAKSDSILVLANQSIQLSCDETLGVDAKQIALTAEKVYLGSSEGIEGTKIQPVVLGDNLNDVLKQISTFLTTLSIAFKTATYTTQTPIGPTKVPITSLNAIADDAETLSNDILNIVNAKNLLSKTVKTV